MERHLYYTAILIHYEILFQQKIIIVLITSENQHLIETTYLNYIKWELENYAKIYISLRQSFMLILTHILRRFLEKNGYIYEDFKASYAIE